MGDRAEAKEIPYGSENRGRGRLAEYDEGAGNQKGPHGLSQIPVQEKVAPLVTIVAGRYEGCIVRGVHFFVERGRWP